MNLERGMIWAAGTVAMAGVLAMGTATLVGVNRDGDGEVPPAGAEMAMDEASNAVDSEATAPASDNLGVEQYRGGGSHGGGSRGGGSHGGGFHGGGAHGGHFGGGHFGGAHASRGGWGHGGWGHGGWGHTRWGRWGGGRYVGGRWVGGPWYGWCDARYYACDPYWYW